MAGVRQFQVGVEHGRLQGRRIGEMLDGPGRHEELAGCPAAKTTGKNLDMLLSLLSGALGRSDLARSEITITNAWPNVEYKAKTGRSEATARELKASSNLERLQRELAEITDFVIFCGAKARAVARHLQLERKPRFLYIEHLGSRSLLPIRTDVEGRPIISADDRISADEKMRGLKSKIQAEITGRRLAVVDRSVPAQLRKDPKDRGSTGDDSRPPFSIRPVPTFLIDFITRSGVLGSPHSLRHIGDT